MNSALALVRHGQTDWNLAGRLQGQTDIPLNQTGRDQARDLGRAMVGQGWDLVLASPLGRAQQTARIIAEQTGAKTGAPLGDLVERGFGQLEGQCRSELDEELVQQLMEQAEPRQQVLHRTVAALQGLVAQNPRQKILCVSHGATMRIVRDTLAGQRLPHGVENGEVIPIDLDRLQVLHGQLLSGEVAVV